MHIPLQREPVEDEIYTCRAEPGCQELAAFRITRTDRLGERITYVCATHRDRAEYAARQRVPGSEEPRVTVTLAIRARHRLIDERNAG